MKIRKITLDNFRCFTHLELELHPELTVLISPNGEGKTAVLDAISCLLGVLLRHFPQISAPRLKRSDFRDEWENTAPDAESGAIWQVVTRAPYMRIAAESFDGLKWDSTIRRDSSAATRAMIPEALGGKAIRRLADHYIDMMNSPEPPSEFFPVFGYYDTGRALDSRRTDKFKLPRHGFKCCAGYRNALDGRLNYREMLLWIYAIEDRQNLEMNRRRDWDYRSIETKTIQLALERMLPGISNLRVRRQPPELIVDIEKNGIFRTCAVDTQLSDAYRMVLGILLDILARIIDLNAGIPGATPEKLLDTSGVIIIDEVDLHLHPQWQQHIIGDLRRTFPRIQFILSTHSPQVLSTVPRECVRIISSDEVHDPDMPTQGVEINDILAGLFNTDPVPLISAVSAKLNQLHQMTAEGEGNTPEWEQLYAELEEYYGKDYPPLLGAKAHNDFMKKIALEDGDA